MLSRQDWQSWCGTLFVSWVDKLIGVLKANEALLKAEMELNGGLEGGGHVGAAQSLRRGVYFLGLTYFKGEFCTFKHYDTLLGDDT